MVVVEKIGYRETEKLERVLNRIKESFKKTMRKSEVLEVQWTYKFAGSEEAKDNHHEMELLILCVCGTLTPVRKGEQLICRNCGKKPGFRYRNEGSYRFEGEMEE